MFGGKGDIKASSSSYAQFQMQEGQVSGVSYVPKSGRKAVGAGLAVAGFEAARSLLVGHQSYPE